MPAPVHLAAAAFACLAVPSPAAQPEAAPDDAELAALVQLYQDLHAHPELSHFERRTSQRLAAELRAIPGCEVTERVGGFGVVGEFANGDGPTVMLRCDMDALPIAEQTGLEYASQVRGENEEGQAVGIMHACGHDVHMTCLIGAARALAAERAGWRGRLLLVCQPAEERGAGARAMLEDRLFERFGRPDFALALHVAHDLPTGTVGYRAGWAMANVDSVDITVPGRGAHGSAPHLAIDPVVIAARLVLDLQTIVARELEPGEPAVVTVGAIHGGTKHNIIPDRCTLQLTVRSYAPEVRTRLLDAIRRKAQAAALSAGAPEPTIELTEGTPALHNDEALVRRLLPVLRAALGEPQVVEIPRSMVGEDFSRYGRAGVPIFLFRLGTVRRERLAAWADAGQAPPGLHTSRYYPDAPESVATGVRALRVLALELLGRE